MLKKCLLQFLIVGCSLGSFLHAHAQTNPRSLIKLGVEKDNVRVLKDGFLIFMNEGEVRVKTLRSDATGLYVFERDFLDKGHSQSRYIKFYICETCTRVFDERGAMEHAASYDPEDGHQHFLIRYR